MGVSFSTANSFFNVLQQTTPMHQERIHETTRVHRDESPQIFTD